MSNRRMEVVRHITDKCNYCLKRHWQISWCCSCFEILKHLGSPLLPPWHFMTLRKAVSVKFCSKDKQREIAIATLASLNHIFLAANPEIFTAHDVVVVRANNMVHEAHSHAQLQTELTVHAQNLAAKAQAHAQAQVSSCAVSKIAIPGISPQRHDHQRAILTVSLRCQWHAYLLPQIMIVAKI